MRTRNDAVEYTVESLSYIIKWDGELKTSRHAVTVFFTRIYIYIYQIKSIESSVKLMVLETSVKISQVSGSWRFQTKVSDMQFKNQKKGNPLSNQWFLKLLLNQAKVSDRQFKNQKKDKKSRVLNLLSSQWFLKLLSDMQFKNQKKIESSVKLSQVNGSWNFY